MPTRKLEDELPVVIIQNAQTAMYNTAKAISKQSVSIMYASQQPEPSHRRHSIPVSNRHKHANTHARRRVLAAPQRGGRAQFVSAFVNSVVASPTCELVVSYTL